MSTLKHAPIQLLLDSNRGIYIPKNFAEECNMEEWHVSAEYAEALKDADGEYYYETWDRVLTNAYWEKDGQKFHLYQDGDLWALNFENMTSEEKNNFGFED